MPDAAATVFKPGTEVLAWREGVLANRIEKYVGP